MRRCIQLANESASSGNYALAALVANDDEIIAESGSNLIKDNNDPSAHPEMMVIRTAAHKMGTRYLPHAILVTTLEPCPMCTSVAIWAKMAGIAYGASQEDAERWSAEHLDETYTWRQIHIRARTIVSAGQPHIELHENVLRDDCTSLFTATKCT
jgi:tRNA(Arg) A34 adenosine deaminase TadA